MENDFLKVIETRRSCRKYKPEQITDEELKAVLEAGTYAPTSRGIHFCQPGKHFLLLHCHNVGRLHAA